MVSPEFRRNLWLEFTAGRVIAGPVIVFICIAAAVAIDLRSSLGRVDGLSFGVTAVVSQLLFFAVTMLWGGRQAAGAVTREIRDRTWDGQRMSAMPPWAMAVGKLFGATSLTWTIGFGCLVAYAVAATLTRGQDAVTATVVVAVGTSLLAQAVGLLASLIWVTGRRGSKGGNVTLFHFIGIVTAITVYYLGFVHELSGGQWYGIVFEGRQFAMLTVWMFALWAVVGVYRRMRLELQMRNRPGIWILFLASVVAWTLGFTFTEETFIGRSFVPGVVVAFFCYALTLVEPKNPLALRHLARLAGQRRWGRALELVPLWLVTYVIACAVILVEILLFQLGLYDDVLGVMSAELRRIAFYHLVALIFFLTRDVLIVLILAFGRDSRYAEVTGFFYWLVLYGPLALIFVVATGRDAYGVFYPSGIGHWTVALLPGFLQMLFCIGLFALRWHLFGRRQEAEQRANLAAIGVAPRA